MPLDRLTRKPARAALPAFVEARVTTAPATLSDELRVVIPELSDQRVYEVRTWMDRGGDLPSVGDTAYIAFAGHEPVLVAWRPS